MSTRTLVDTSTVQTATGKTLGSGCNWQGNPIGLTYGGTGTASTPSNGQLLIGGNNIFNANTLLTGPGIRVTNGVGTIYIDASATVLSSATYSLHGKCRLDWTNPTTLTLNRYDGSHLIIATSATSIPIGGIASTNSGLSANTLYRVYAMLNSANVMELRFNTGTASLDGGGVKVLNSDSTMTLVGMASTNNDTRFIRSATGNQVISYFNRRMITTATPLQSSKNTSSSSFVEIDTQSRMNFVTWGDSEVVVRVMGAKAGSAVNIGYSSIGIDNFTTATDVSGIVQIASDMAFNVTLATLLSEGAHQASLLGESTGGTTYTWVGGLTVGQRGCTFVTVMG